MRREYVNIRAGAFSVDAKVERHLAERSAGGWTLEHVTTIRFRGRYEHNFFWVRDD